MSSLGVVSSLESVRCRLGSHLSQVMAQQNHLQHLERLQRLEAFGSQDRAKSLGQRDEGEQLRFSVHNILRPEFGRDAILKTRPSKSPPPPPVDGSQRSADSSSPPQRADGRSSPTAFGSRTSSSSCSSSLSRSGSLESLASSKSSVTSASTTGSETDNGQQSLWPAWIYCTRYSDRPSSGPRSRRLKRPSGAKATSSASAEEKRPRTAFSAEQLAKLKIEFAENKYLTEQRRQKLSKDLGLNEQQIKIWFQNKRAKNKKASGHKNPLALQLMAQGLYNHSTVPVDEDGQEIHFPQDS